MICRIASNHLHIRMFPQLAARVERNVSRTLFLVPVNRSLRGASFTYAKRPSCCFLKSTRLGATTIRSQFNGKIIPMCRTPTNRRCLTDSAKARNQAASSHSGTARPAGRRRRMAHRRGHRPRPAPCPRPGRPSSGPTGRRSGTPGAIPFYASASFSPVHGRSLAIRPSPGHVRPGWNSAVPGSGEPGACRNETRLGETPDRDQQLGGKRHNHHPADPSPASGSRRWRRSGRKTIGRKRRSRAGCGSRDRGGARAGAAGGAGIGGRPTGKGASSGIWGSEPGSRHSQTTSARRPGPSHRKFAATA